MSSQPGVDKAQAHMLKCMGGCVGENPDLTVYYMKYRVRSPKA
jgi:hypothetical protein